MVPPPTTQLLPTVRETKACASPSPGEAGPTSTPVSGLEGPSDVGLCRKTSSPEGRDLPKDGEPPRGKTWGHEVLVGGGVGAQRDTRAEVAGPAGLAQPSSQPWEPPQACSQLC